MNQGWIKIHRKLLDNPIAKKPKYAWLWMVILLKANHGDEKFLFNGKIEVCKRGQLLTGREKLAMDSGIRAGTVEVILNYLESQHQIQQQKTNKYRLITVKNYGEYQSFQQHNLQQNDNKMTTNLQQNDTNNNDKNVKNEKKDNTIVLSDAKLRHKQDIDLILKTLKEKLEIPRLDLSEKINRQYAWILLRKSKKGVEGVLWLIDLAASDAWWRNHITSVRDLWANQIKLVSQKRGDKNAIAVI